VGKNACELVEQPAQSCKPDKRSFCSAATDAFPNSVMQQPESVCISAIDVDGISFAMCNSYLPSTLVQTCDTIKNECTSDSLSLKIATQKCEAIGIEAQCVDNNPTIINCSSKTCDGDYEVTYTGACQGTSPNAKCKTYSTTRFYCPNKNERTCTNLSYGSYRNWATKIYTCDTVAKTCAIDPLAVPTSGFCTPSQRQCSSDGKTYTITAGQKCNYGTATGYNCVSDGTAISSGTCPSSLGDCSQGPGNAYQIAGTVNYTCNNTDVSPGTSNCLPAVTPNRISCGAGKQCTSCNPETRQCVNNNTAVQITPAQGCDVVPANGGTTGVCLPSTPNAPLSCVVPTQYQCVNDLASHIFYAKKYIGYCDNTANCNTRWTTENQLACNGDEVPWSPEEKKCSSAGIMQEMGNMGCTLPNGDNREPSCGPINKHPKLIQDCPLHCINTYSCSGTKVVGKKSCTGCKDLSCTTWEEAMPGIDCSPASTTKTNFCSGGMQCTITSTYSGKCYEPPVENGNAKCEMPTVDPPVCSGPCSGGKDSDGDGIPDDQDSDDDNDGIPDDRDTDDDGDGNPDIPNEPPCSITCPDGNVIDCGGECPVCVDKICPDGSKVACDANCPENPPCTKTCSDGSEVPCNADCPPCTKACPDGSVTTCDAECPCKKTCEDGSVVNCTDPCPCVNKVCADGSTVGCNDECPGAPESFCNENKKCVIIDGGLGAIRCTDIKDCENTCSEDLKCEKNGGGAGCSENSECLPSETIAKCVLNNGQKQCRPDNCGGDNCKVDADCQNSQTFCDSTCQKCVPGGDTGVPCADDAVCQFGCAGDDFPQCVFGGAGAQCNPYDSKCFEESFNCNADRQCVPDECGGASCDPANEGAECQGPTQCNDCMQCVPGGTGPLCDTNEDCQLQEGEPPQVTGLTVVPKPCTGTVSFQWTYIKGSIENTETHWWLEIYDGATLVFSKNGNSQLNNPHQVEVKNLEYNKTYKWYVKEQERDLDGNFQDSGWVSATYKTPKHADPYSLFAVLPTTITAGGTVNFTESPLSTCYGNTGAHVVCKVHNWDFGDNTENVTTINPSHIYTAKGNYTATLTLCDENRCCSSNKGISVDPKDIKDLPIWKEISPFFQ